MKSVEFFIGTVEDVDDPDKMGRVRVRIYSYHDDTVLKDELSWIMSLQPYQSSGFLGVGISPTGIEVGSTVIGVFLDYEIKQTPFILGTITSLNDIHKTINSETDPIPNEIKIPKEPDTEFKTKYPYNMSYASRKNDEGKQHVLEIDDTPGHERIRVHHKSGTYNQINSKGDNVIKIVGDSYELIAGNKEVYIDGDCNIVIRGDANILVDGNLKTEVKGDYSLNCSGSITFNSDSYDLSSSKITMGGDNIDINGGVVNIDDVVNLAGGGAGSPKKLTFNIATENIKSEIIAEEEQQRDEAGALLTSVDVDKHVYFVKNNPRSQPISIDPNNSINNLETANTEIIKTSCGDLSETSEIGVNNLKISDFTVNTIFPHALPDQNMGIPKSEIMCNIKALVENIVDPIMTKYKKESFGDNKSGKHINSGFRKNHGKSQHNIGQACDLQFNNKDNKESFEVAKWIAENLNYDQLIFEHSGKTGNVWIHVSFNRNSQTQRNIVLTMHMNRYIKGLHLFS